MAAHLGQLVGAGQRAHVVGEVEAAPSLHACERLGEARHEGVVDGVVHVDALDADAELAAVGADAPHGARARRARARVGQDQHGVLAAELQAQLISRSPHCAATMRPVAVEPVNMMKSACVDERRAELGAAAGDHLEEAGGQARLLQQVGRPEGGERRLRVGLDDHGVAGDQRRDGVADAERERVVPGRDDADQARGGGDSRAMVSTGSAPWRAARAQEARAPCARSSAPGWRCRAPPRRRACAPCRDSSWMRSRISVALASSRSWKRRSTAARSAERRRRPCALCLARGRAGRLTSSGAPWGTSPSISPVNGASTGVAGARGAAARAARRASIAALTPATTGSAGGLAAPRTWPSNSLSTASCLPPASGGASAPGPFVVVHPLVRALDELLQRGLVSRLPVHRAEAE